MIEPVRVDFAPARSTYQVGANIPRGNEDEMKFLMMVRCAEDIGDPPESLMQAMGELMEARAKSGALLQAAGLGPTSQAVRVRTDGKKVHVIDGPFTETKEVIGGFAIMQASSREEAIESGREFIQLHVDHWPGFVGESEVRQIEDE